MHVLVASTVAYVGAVLGIALMYVWYVPRASCRLNSIFISVTLLLVLLMTFVSANSKVKAGYLAPGLMGVYVVFLCWAAIRRYVQCRAPEFPTNFSWQVAYVS